MPREAVATGFVDRVVPLDDIPTEILLKGFQKSLPPGKRS
jgi:chemotaxis response regulator CheB